MMTLLAPRRYLYIAAPREELPVMRLVLAPLSAEPQFGLRCHVDAEYLWLAVVI
jgi:hypothetical protein